ncbi:MAG: SH3 domain-containing protein [Proteobacteria bacterium]|nr:SH3 domain-containing protein [Pseudomonadota bacterium]
MRTFKALIIIIFVLAILPITASHSQTSGWEETYFKANMAYKQGRFSESVDGYTQLIRAGYKNGHMYYNLGNAYLRMDLSGYAILNYERARILIPRDADLKYNLKYARDRIQDAIEEPHGFLEMAFFWIGSTNMMELFYCFAGLNIFFWGILFVRLFKKTEWIYYASMILFIVWMISGTSLGIKWYLLNTDDRAVILEKEANIHAGPDAKDTLLFKLHEGTVVHHERSEEGWSIISLPDKKRGWINNGALKNIINNEPLSKRFSLVKLKAGENFNHRNTVSISRIEI